MKGIAQICLLFSIVVVLGCSPESANKQQQADSASSAKIPPNPDAPWTYSVRKDEMTDENQVVFTNYAVHGMHDEEMILRCGKKVDFYINTDSFPMTAYGEAYEANVKIRFDQGKSRSELWGRSDDGKALFAERTKPLLSEMIHHDKLLFEWTPVGDVRTVATFDVRKLSETLVKYQACGAKAAR